MTKNLPLFFAISIALSACNSSSKTVTNITDLGDSERAALLKDMAALDKPYVTTLFYSNMQASPSLFNDAKITINTLGDQWSRFKTARESTFDSTNWRDGFSKVDDDFAMANSHYATINTFPADLTTAHLAMEDVREVMRNMRGDIGLDTYLMDSVTDTHHKMEPISKGYAAYSASNDAAAIDTLKSILRTSLPPFAEALQKLNQQYGDASATADLYNLSSQKSARLSANISNNDPQKPGLVQIVGALNNELADDNNPKIVQLSSNIKGKFVSIFLGFGDFITPFKQDFIDVQKSIIPMLYCTGNPPDADSVCLNETSTPKQGALSYVTQSAAALTKLKAHFPSNEKTNVPRLLGWEQIFTNIDASLSKANNTLTQATDLEVAKNNGAHLDAEAIRDAFYSLVASYEGQVTVMTRMDEYHAVFEKMLLTVMDGNVSNADVETMKTLMPQLQTTFDNLSASVLDADKDVWGISGIDLASLLTPQQNNINSLLDELSAFDGTSNDNGSIIAEKAKALKGLYIPLFKAFGAF